MIKDSRRELTQILTVNDRIDEKKVPSSYLDNLDNTPSNTETNCNTVDSEYLECDCACKLVTG